MPGRLLEYTTASDVLPILEAEQRLVVPFFGPQLLTVGNIYQRFTSPDDNGQGQVSTSKREKKSEERTAASLCLVAEHQIAIAPGCGLSMGSW
jgi:hypothetical protein